MTSVEHYQPLSTARNISQATTIEQQRATVEVQAAVLMARQFPRDVHGAAEEMRYACSRMILAEDAFYKVPNRGTGPSVHLMRELARIWGNIDFGVKELSRDDSKGESEVLSHAWDLERNTRVTRSFIQPHERMKGKLRQKLTDLNDIYLSNQNVGARAVRECIQNVLPRWFVQEAQDICHQTLQKGDGKPLEERIAAVVDAFRALDVTLAQLESRVGAKRDKWAVGDVASLTILGKSIKRGETTVGEEFPPVPVSGVTVEQVVGRGKAGRGGGDEQREGAEPSSGTTPQTPAADQAPTPTPDAPEVLMISAAQSKRLHALLGAEGLGGSTKEARDAKLEWLSANVGRPVGSSSELTDDEAGDLIAVLEHAQAGGDQPEGEQR